MLIGRADIRAKSVGNGHPITKKTETKQKRRTLFDPIAKPQANPWRL
jgi:hypothetical protein